MIVVSNLIRNFGDFRAVNDISFDVGPGEIFALLGPNGAGKTTIIKILTTLLPATSGIVRVDGFDSARQANEVRKRVGIVFQDTSLDQALTAYENLELHAALYRLSRRVWRERARQLLILFELWGRRDRLVKEFSGGMIRRLEIARSLLHTPRILFLDEPTLGLDPQSRSQLWTHVRDLNSTEGMTVFLTTHYMDEADRVATRMAVIDHGRIAAIGSPIEIKERTTTTSLEDAYLQLTGTAIREERADTVDQMRRVVRTTRRL